jgi:hypothetical protein
MTTQIERQPAGITPGGQFAATQHAEPGIALEAPAGATDHYWDGGDNCSCGKSLDDGQGWDGKCGDCADIAENTDECSGCGDLLEVDEKADGICEDCAV